MYKFICANIAKSRNFTHSYKKLAQANKIHQDISRPQSAQPSLEENVEDGQEHFEEEIKLPKSSRPTSISSRTPKTTPITVKLSTFKGSAPLKVKEHPKFCRMISPGLGNFIRSDPPTASISKRYYHLYSINPSTVSKRACCSLGSRNATDEEARDNYRRAMEKLYNMQRDKAVFQFKEQDVHPLSGKSQRSLKVKQKKKVAGKTGITYPTHTYKHNLTLSRRYRLREASGERKVRELEEKFAKRMNMQRKVFKAITAETITYPKLVENFKKNRLASGLPCVELNPVRPESPLVKVGKAQPQVLTARLDQEKDEYIKSHPTMEDASKEAKMRLKTKFIQLLLKSAKSSTKPEQASRHSELELGAVQKKEEPAEKVLQVAAMASEPCSVVPAKKTEEALVEADSVPLEPSKAAPPEDYPRKYPKRVWVNDTNIDDLNLEDVCMKESATRTAGSGIVYAKEAPKPNYKKVEEEAQKLSQFVKKIQKLHCKSDPERLRKGAETGTASKALEQLKQEQTELIRELEEVDHTLAGKLEDQIRTRQSSEKMRKILTGALWGDEVLFDRALVGKSEAQSRVVLNEHQDVLRGDAGERHFTGNLRPKIIKNKTRQAVGKRTSEGTTASLYHTEQKGEKLTPKDTHRSREGNDSGKKTETALAKEKNIENSSANEQERMHIDDVVNAKIRAVSDENSVETKCEDLFLLVRAQKRLEDPTHVEELNERAREKEETFSKRRRKDAERDRVEKLKNHVQSLPSLKAPNVVPRVDKVNDRLEEKVEIAEKSKKKIQSLTRFNQVPENLAKRLVLFKRAPDIKSGLDQHSKYDELNQAARKIAQKHQKLPVSNAYSLEQPVAKEPTPEKLKTRENDLKEEQDRKVKDELEQFYQKKKQQWDGLRFQLKRTSNVEGDEVCLDKTEWAALRAKRILKGPIEVIEVLAPTKYIKEQNVILFAGKQPNDLPEDEQKRKTAGKADKKAKDKAKPEEPKQKQEQADEQNQEVKEEHHGFALYPPYPKQGRGKQASEDINTDGDHLGPVTMSGAHQVPEIKEIKYSEVVGGKDNNDLGKEVLLLESQQLDLPLLVSGETTAPVVQEVTYKTENVPKDFKEHILKQYMDAKILSESQQSVYMGKERLIINNIKDVDGQGATRDHKSDGAVLRPGDEIVFVANSDNKNNSTGSESDSFLPNPLENAIVNTNDTLALGAKLAVAESRALIDTKNQIGEMMRKINELEAMVKLQQQSLVEEKKSENKIRAPPPKRPDDDIKKKDIKKDRPKGPNDMILPPKVTGSQTEKVPRERKETEKKAADNKGLLDKQRLPGQQKERPSSSMSSKGNHQQYKLNTCVEKSEQKELRKVLLGSDENVEHTEKLRKYFAKKFGPKMAVENVKEEPGNSAPQSVAAETSMPAGKKILKKPKSKSLTYTKAEEQKKAGKFKLDGNKSTYEGLQVKRSVSQLSTGKKMDTKSMCGRPVSCPPVCTKCSGTTVVEKSDQKASKTTKIFMDLGEGKTKFSSWATHNISHQGTNKEGLKAVKRAVSDQAADSKTGTEKTSRMSKDSNLKSMKTESTKPESKSYLEDITEPDYSISKVVKRLSVKTTRTSNFHSDEPRQGSDLRQVDNLAENQSLEDKNAQQVVGERVGNTKKRFPKVIRAEQATHRVTPTKKPKSVIELSAERGEAQSKSFWTNDNVLRRTQALNNINRNQASEQNNQQPKQVLELSEAVKESADGVDFSKNESPELHRLKPESETCMADNNLRQAEPIGTLNVKLPQHISSNRTSPGRGLSQKVKVTGYKSERTFFSGKTLRMERSKAAISTSSAAKLNDKNFGGKRRPGKVTGQQAEGEKTAIFRIQSDGEVFIVKKADESFGKVVEPKKELLVVKPQECDYMDRVKNDIELTNAKGLVEESPDMHQTSQTEPLTAKIRTIYDKESSRKIRENKQNWNQPEKCEQRPQAWKPLFGDLGAADFQKVKEQFFEDCPRDTIINRHSVTTLDSVSQKQRKAKAVDLKRPLTQAKKADVEEAKVAYEHCDSMYLNKKYAQMLKNIEKRLTEKKKLEKMRQVTNKLLFSNSKVPSFKPQMPKPAKTGNLAEINRTLEKARIKQERDEVQEPFKDLTYQGTVKSDCLIEPQRSDLYTLNVLEQKRPRSAEVKGNLYKINQPLSSRSIEGQEENLVLKKRIIYNTILKVAPLSTGKEPKRAARALDTEPSKQLPKKSKFRSNEKLISDDRLVAEVESWNLSLLRNMEKRKSQTALAGPALKEKPGAIMRCKSYATTPIDKDQQPAEEGKLEKDPSSSSFSVVKKLISEDNLACEVESWGLSVLRNVEKRKAQSVRESKHPKLEEPEVPKAEAPKVKGKRRVALSETQVNTRFNKHDATVQFKVVSEKRKPEPKKYPLDAEEKFMYVEKSIRNKLEKQALRTKPDSAAVRSKPGSNGVNKVDINQFRKSFAIVSRTEIERRKRKEELQEMVFKSKKEQNEKQHEQRSKKEKVDQMNNAAAHILRKKTAQENEEMSKGNRRQCMYRNDAKVVQPSVGTGPWGNKMKPVSINEDKKEFHSGTNINMARSKDVLISKAEFLRLKKASSKHTAKAGQVQGKMAAKTAKVQLQNHKELNVATEANKQVGRNLFNIVNARTKLEIQEKNLQAQMRTVEENPSRFGADHRVKKQTGFNEEAPPLELQTDAANLRRQQQFDLKIGISQLQEGKPPLNVQPEMKIQDKPTSNVHEAGKSQNQPTKAPSEGRGLQSQPKEEPLKLEASETDREAKSSSRGETIERYLDDKPTAELEIKGKKRTEQECDSLKLQQRDVTYPVLSTACLNFKITQMAKLIVDDMRVQESLKNSADLAASKTAEEIELVAKTGREQLTAWKKDEERSEAIGPDPQGTSQDSQSVGIRAEEGSNQTVSDSKVSSEVAGCDNKCGVVIKCPAYQQDFDEDNNQKVSATGSPVSTSQYKSEKAEVDKMIDLKRKNKENRRLRSGNLKNMISQPESESHPRSNKADSDKEEPDAKIVKGANFIFKPPTKLTVPVLTLERPNLSHPKAHCNKLLLLPMKKLQSFGEKVLERQTTLEKPLSDAIKEVPKEMSGTPGKAEALGPSAADPLSKYRHLKITYVTVKKPQKKQEETFLPDAVKRVTEETAAIDQEEQNRVLNYRFELLKRLNEEFQRQQPDQVLPPPSTAPKAQETVERFDSNWDLKDVKSYLDKEKADMKVTKSLIKVRPSNGHAKTAKCKSGFGTFKNGDDKERPGGRRCYSTEEKDTGHPIDKTGIEICQSQLEDTEADLNAHSEKNEETKACEQDFDVLEAVPHAFECPSPQLEENRQADLYYRHHKYSFVDLHHYLSDKRVSAVDGQQSNMSNPKKGLSEKSAEHVTKGQCDDSETK